MSQSIAEQHEARCQLPNNYDANYRVNFAHFEQTKPVEIIKPKGNFIAHKFF